RLISISNRIGLTQTLTYSDASTPVTIAPKPGLLIRVTDAFDRQLSFTYDAQARMAAITDPSGGVFQYAYDATGNPTSVTQPGGTVRSYLYENTSFPNLLTGITDENSQRFATWTYDAQKRASSSVNGASANSVTLSYAGAAQASVTDAR